MKRAYRIEDMKIGISTFVWASPFSTADFKILSKVKEYGYDVVEIAVEDKELIDFVKLKNQCKSLGLAISISGAFGMERDISSENPEFRSKGLSYIKDCLDIANYMESPIFGGPLYSAVGKTRLVSNEQKREERMWCLENLSLATKYAREKGVKLALEPLNRFKTDMINTVDQALELINEVNDEYLQLLLDTFHNNIEEKSIPDAIRKIGKQLLHIQGNENDRGIPGTGHVDWIGIHQALIDIGYEGSIVIETFGAPSKELARAASIWRPLAESPDILAKEGADFLKRIFKS